MTLKNGDIFSMYHVGDRNQGVSLLMIYPQHAASFANLANPPDYQSPAGLDVKGSVMAYSTLLV